MPPDNPHPRDGLPLVLHRGPLTTGTNLHLANETAATAHRWSADAYCSDAAQSRYHSARRHYSSTGTRRSGPHWWHTWFPEPETRNPAARSDTPEPFVGCFPPAGLQRPPHPQPKARESLPSAEPAVTVPARPQKPVRRAASQHWPAESLVRQLANSSFEAGTLRQTMSGNLQIDGPAAIENCAAHRPRPPPTVPQSAPDRSVAESPCRGPLPRI